MDNKELIPIDKFIKQIINPYDGVKWKDGMLPLDETKVETEAKSKLFYTDISDSPNVIPYLSSNINFLKKELEKLDTKMDKELEKLDTKMDKELEKLDTKMDKSNDRITSDFRWPMGILFILFLALAGWVFYINK